MTRPRVNFWAGWLLALVLTGLIFLWHQPIYPFSSPGVAMNETANFILLAAGMRWVAMAAIFVDLSLDWTGALNARKWVHVMTPITLLAIHAAAGLVNLILWNAWVSAGTPHSQSGDKALAGIYFAIPLAALLVLAGAKVTAPKSGSAPL